ncbi:hypothetical protein HDU77_001774 [Chytriomyces hyalinus]|nr:hypothetical protein HDU77_001774 [Chytriomyces hyalinus]
MLQRISRLAISVRLARMQSTQPNSIEALTQLDASSEDQTQFIPMSNLSFEAIGASPRISANLLSGFSITHPTETQAALFPAVLSHRDLVLKDVTGSGKSFGLLAAILSKKAPLVLQTPSLDLGKKASTPGEEQELAQRAKRIRYVANIIMAPTPELALQYFEWAQVLLKGIHSSDLPKHVQVLVPQGHYKTQHDLLTSSPPNLIIGTPRRLQDVIMNEPIVDISRLQTIILDEADVLARIPTRFESNKKKLNRINHPLYSEVLMEHILQNRRPESIGGTLKMQKSDADKPNDNFNFNRFNKKVTSLPASLNRTKEAHAVLRRRKETNPNQIVDPAAARRLQVVLCSATMNNHSRKELERMRGWIVDPVIMDVNGTHSSPSSIDHVCVIVTHEGRKWRNIQSKEEQIKEHEAFKTSLQEKGKDTSRFGPVWTYKSLFPALEDDDPIVMGLVAHFCQVENVKRGILFLNSNISCAKVVDQLRTLGVKAARITEDIDFRAASSGTMTEADLKAQQEKGLKTAAFKSKVFFQNDQELMVISEHNARGLDLPDVSHVFLVGPPSSPASYLHMSGRVGRFGKPGKAISILGGERYEVKAAEMYELFKIKPKEYDLVMERK